MTSSNLATPLAHRSAAITAIATRALLTAACSDGKPTAHDPLADWFEPRSVRVAHWPVVAGEFTFPDASEEICAGQPPQTITLTGATVETPLGPVELDPIEITNTGFGCFAG